MAISVPGIQGPPGPPGSALIPQPVQTVNFAAAVNQFFPVDSTGGAVAVTFPAHPPDKSSIAVQMVAGTATVTITAGGTDVFVGGAASTSLTRVGLGATWTYSAGQGVWYPQSTVGVAPVIPVTKTLNFTITTASLNSVWLADATSAPITATLPSAIEFTGSIVITAVTTTTNFVTVTPVLSQTIAGLSSVTVGTAASGAVYSSLTLVSDGTNWQLV